MHKLLDEIKKETLTLASELYSGLQVMAPATHAGL